MVAEVLDVHGRELATVQQAAPTTLYGTNEPVAILAHATAQANALAQVIEQKHLYATINNRKHVLLEGWTTLGALVGVFAVPVWTRPIEDNGERIGWEARVEARTMAGQIVGAAEAECLTTERHWGERDDYALRSMAQTRASSKALRLPLGFIMTLAGFDATPADEMPREDARPQQANGSRPAPAPRPQQQRPQPPRAQSGDARRPVSDAQKNAIHKLLAALKGKNPTTHDRLLGRWTMEHTDLVADDGALVLTVLDVKQASAFMDDIGAAMREANGEAADPDDLPFE